MSIMYEIKNSPWTNPQCLKGIYQSQHCTLAMVAHPCNPKTQEAKARRLQVLNKLGLYNEFWATLSQIKWKKQNNQKIKIVTKYYIDTKSEIFISRNYNVLNSY